MHICCCSIRHVTRATDQSAGLPSWTEVNMTLHHDLQSAQIYMLAQLLLMQRNRLLQKVHHTLPEPPKRSMLPQPFTAQQVFRGRLKGTKEEITRETKRFKESTINMASKIQKRLAETSRVRTILLREVFRRRAFSATIWKERSSRSRPDSPRAISPHQKLSTSLQILSTFPVSQTLIDYRYSTLCQPQVQS